MEHELAIPKIYALPEAAELLGVSEHWLLMQIRKGRFAAMKRGRHWAMTEPRILAAIEAMTVPAREPEVYPGGITRRSFQRRLPPD
jgi:excisionase family DNA binding protein